MHSVRYSGALSLLVVFFILPLVHASYHSSSSAPEFLGQGVRDVVAGLREGLTPIFEALIGDYSTSEFFFSKVLVLILLFAVSSMVLRNLPTMKDNPFIANLVGLIVSLIAVRYISENEFTLGILLPYAVWGIVMSILIPAALIFFSIHLSNIGGAGRRIIWMIVFVVYLVIWLSRSRELPSVVNHIYGWSLLGMFLLIAFDRGIHRYFQAWELNTFYRGANQKTIAALQAEYLQIINVNTPAASARRAAIVAHLNSFGPGHIP